MQSVFMLADDMAGPPKIPKSAQGSKYAGRGQGRPSKQEQKQQPPASKPAAKPSQSRSATAETRTCSGCFVKGSLYRNCPDNPNRPMASEIEVVIASGKDKMQTRTSTILLCPSSPT